MKSSISLFLDATHRPFAEAVSRATFCNPFLPQRIEAERAALGSDFIETDCQWNLRAEMEGSHPNIRNLTERCARVAEELRSRLIAGAMATDAELLIYEDLVIFVLYHNYVDRFIEGIAQAQRRESGRQRTVFYPQFLHDAEHFLALPGRTLPWEHNAPHLFACLFQVARAFQHIFGQIVGASPAAARLRAAVWQSIFTHDMRRYRRSLYPRMGDITTLITGPSGTGKELVARAIALSRYIPFDPKTLSFKEDFAGAFFPLNLSALSPTLIESELFGHRRGAFTGALEDRAGWLEVCPPLGTVFLDEIGETDSAIQVKLLRVLQTRTFQRLGDTQARRFQGKIITATNRDPAEQMRTGHLRRDFYYRLCSDMIVTPSLRQQLEHSPEELRGLILFVARREAGAEAEALAEQVWDWVRRELGEEYPWPGNFRELEQCVRNVLVRNEYRPARTPGRSAAEELAQAVVAGSVGADELLGRYVTLVYSRDLNYEETARRLGLDRRTVKARIDPALLARLQSE